MKASSIQWKIAAAIFFVCYAGTAFAQVSAGVDLAMKSQYIWRGIPFNDEAVFWPDVWASWNGFTAVVFGSLEMTDVYQNRGKFTEVDYYLDYSRTFGPITAKLGYSHFEYPNTDFDPTGEIYGEAALDLPFFSVALNLYYDVEEVQGFYVSPKISKSMTVPFFQPTLQVSLGYADKKFNGYWFGLEEAGFTDLTAGLDLTYTPPGALGNYLTLSGDLNYAMILDGKFADIFPDQDTNFWWGLGVHLAYTFGGEQ